MSAPYQTNRIDWTLSLDKNLLLLQLPIPYTMPHHTVLSPIAASLKLGFSSTMTIPRIRVRLQQLSTAIVTQNYTLRHYANHEVFTSNDGQVDWTPRSDRDLLMFVMRDRRREDLEVVAMMLRETLRVEIWEGDVRARLQELWEERERMEEDYEAEHLQRMRRGR